MFRNFEGTLAREDKKYEVWLNDEVRLDSLCAEDYHKRSHNVYAVIDRTYLD